MRLVFRWYLGARAHGDVQRGVAAVVGGGHARAPLQQQRHHLHAARPHRAQQRRVAALETWQRLYLLCCLFV